MKTSRLALLAAVPLVSTALSADPAFAQEVTAEPLVGTLTLDAGFLPNPSITAVTASGDLWLPGSAITDAATGSSCPGHVASAQPDVRLHYSGGMRLQIGARATDDTTLLVNLPDGTWRCVDDTHGLDPALTFEPAPAGQYDIWVGTLLETPAPAELLFTEFDGSTVWQAGAAAEAPLWAQPLDPSLPSTWG